MTQSDNASFQGPSWQLARQVLELAEGELLADNRFLAPSLALLQPRPERLCRPLATDGRALMLDADRLLDRFRQERKAPVADVSHLLIHCLLLHPFTGPSLDADDWSLAADIVAESLTAEIVGPRPGERGQLEHSIVARITSDLDGRLTTERLYRRLRDGAYADERAGWRELFASDDHSPWQVSAAEDDETEDGDGSPNEDGRDGAPSHRAATAASGAQDGSNSDGQESAPAAKPRIQDAADPALEEARELWQKAARSTRVDLETLSRERGGALGGLVRALGVSDHEQVDFREFLRQFATRHEEPHVSDDEFDYVFYTYGLELYGDMPLIEPLEYRSEKRIHDFALILDTSSSVTGKTIQQFVDACYDVLTSESSFSQQVNIHIIQADMKVRSDTAITSMADLDRWRRHIKVSGFGGTDFRPALRYVRELQQEGAFHDLRGVIYFTDGWGIYPRQMPPFPVAFVFYDEDHRPDLVPAWAIQLTLHPGEFESLSVY